jgi:gamma-glutamyltranspeptidase/glutathione hydrolase
MPLLFRPAGADAVTVLAGQGPAPAGATIEAVRELALDTIPGSGLLAAAVPGATDAWLMLLRDHGSLPLRAILRYAIEYAEHGHPIVQPVAAAISRVRDIFVDHWPSSAAVYLDRGRAPTPGSRLRNPWLAATYRRLVDEAEVASADPAGQAEAARRAWRTGFVAEAVDRFARLAAMDSSGRAHAGVLTADDIAAWEPAYETPAAGRFRDWTVFKTRPWGQGPVLLQQLAVLEGFAPRELRWGSARLVHIVVEGAKLAFADREAWYGDVPDVPLATLLGRPYNEARRGLLGAEASLELRPGAPDGRTPRLPTLPAAAGQADGRAGLGDPTLDRVPGRGDTCHVDVVDRHGNLVSATPSGGWLMSSPVIPELGFALGTRLQTMWLEPGLPNSLAPGRRPRTTLTPSIARRDDGTWMAFGTPGGDQQDQWQLVFLLGHVVGGLGLQAAIDAPTWHTTAFPSSFEPREVRWGEVVVESRVGAHVIRELRRRGHRVVVSGPWSLARMSAVSADPDGFLRAAANPRGMQGYAVGR